MNFIRRGKNAQNVNIKKKFEMDLQAMNLRNAYRIAKVETQKSKILI